MFVVVCKKLYYKYVHMNVQNFGTIKSEWTIRFINSNSSSTITFTHYHYIQKRLFFYFSLYKYDNTHAFFHVRRRCIWFVWLLLILILLLAWYRSIRKISCINIKFTCLRTEKHIFFIENIEIPNMECPFWHTRDLNTAAIATSESISTKKQWDYNNY